MRMDDRQLIERMMFWMLERGVKKGWGGREKE